MTNPRIPMIPGRQAAASASPAATLQANDPGAMWASATAKAAAHLGMFQNVLICGGIFE